MSLSLKYYVIFHHYIRNPYRISTDVRNSTRTRPFFSTFSCASRRYRQADKLKYDTLQRPYFLGNYLAPQDHQGGCKELKEHLENLRIKATGLKDFKNVAYGLYRFVAAAHPRNFAHRDLNPDISYPSTATCGKADGYCVKLEL